MSETTTESVKIETKPQTYRVPVDVIEILSRWASETGQSVTQCMTNCIRVSAEDEKCMTKASEGGKNVIQEGKVGASVIQVLRPRTRDELADVFTLLIDETRARIGERDQISALGVCRARLYKSTAEYQSAKPMRDAGKLPPSPYENEKALAAKLSGTVTKAGQEMREKG